MRLAALLLSILLLAFTHFSSGTHVADRELIIETNQQVREGFASQDIAKILQYHHPKVEKVFAWDDYQKGHADMEAALSATFQNYTLTFEGSPEDMDSLEIFGQTAVMIAPFSITGTPTNDEVGPFVFSGRTMIVYVRDSRSPTGWMTLREMIVPAS